MQASLAKETAQLHMYFPKASKLALELFVLRLYCSEAAVGRFVWQLLFGFWYKHFWACGSTVLPRPGSPVITALGIFASVVLRFCCSAKAAKARPRSPAPDSFRGCDVSKNGGVNQGRRYSEDILNHTQPSDILKFGVGVPPSKRGRRHQGVSPFYYIFMYVSTYIYIHTYTYLWHMYRSKTVMILCPEMWYIHPTVWPSNGKNIVINDGTSGLWDQRRNGLCTSKSFEKHSVTVALPLKNSGTLGVQNIKNAWV
jgi:hypothetical protein